MMFRSTAGLTLMSTLVAVALSGVIAVFAAKMITGQVRVAKVSELIDKREAILKYYTTLLKDEQVWKCTLYSNTGLRNYIMGAGGSPPSNVTLVGSNCTFSTHEQDKQYVGIGGVTPTNTIIAGGNLTLGESITDADPDGWWKLELSSTAAGGSAAVDLKLEICLDRDKYAAAYPSGVPQELKYICPAKKLVRVRHSENSVDKGVNEVCKASGKAVVDIALHDDSPRREVSCSTLPLVPTSTSPDKCLPKFAQIGGTVTCSAGVGVKPRDCDKAAIQKITDNSDPGGTGNNIICSWPLMLEGSRSCSSNEVVGDLSEGKRVSDTPAASVTKADPGTVFCGKDEGFRGCVGKEYGM